MTPILPMIFLKEKIVMKAKTIQIVFDEGLRGIVKWWS